MELTPTPLTTKLTFSPFPGPVECSVIMHYLSVSEGYHYDHHHLLHGASEAHWSGDQRVPTSPPQGPTCHLADPCAHHHRALHPGKDTRTHKETLSQGLGSILSNQEVNWW